MTDHDARTANRNEFLKGTACLIGLRGWVAREAAALMVLRGFAFARVVVLPGAQRTGSCRTVQVVDLSPRAEDLVAEMRDLIGEGAHPTLCELQLQPMPRVLRKWVVSEAFLHTLPRAHLRHVEVRWWAEGSLFS